MCNISRLLSSFPKYNKYLKIEHAGEHIHAKYNRLEKNHENQKNRGKSFF